MQKIAQKRPKTEKQCDALLFLGAVGEGFEPPRGN
jgi:hypothetical protein